MKKECYNYLTTDYLKCTNCNQEYEHTSEQVLKIKGLELGTLTGYYCLHCLENKIVINKKRTYKKITVMRNPEQII